MPRPQSNPLRILTEDERKVLLQTSRSQTLSSVVVIRARLLLAVADGMHFLQAAKKHGRSKGDSVSQLVARFNEEGLAALEPRHGGGPQTLYNEPEQQRILQEFQRTPTVEQDGTATWSLNTLQKALRNAPDGLPKVSTYVIWQVLHQAGYTYQQSRSWCSTGEVQRKRKTGVVTVTDPDTDAKKKLIEKAYTTGEKMGLPVWCTDQAGPFSTLPYPGSAWSLEGKPEQYPHEYIRNGTAKILTLFHPATGSVQVQGVQSTTNEILHGWLKQQLSLVLESLPVTHAAESQVVNREQWEDWQKGLTIKPTLPAELPPLRMFLVLDNLAGHKTPEFVLWLFSQGIMPLYTPLSGSWLNMAESIQRILKRRALQGQHPRTPQQIMDWFEAAAKHWNLDPTPFEWGGKRKRRRERQRERRHKTGGSGACTRKPIRRRSRMEVSLHT